VGWGFLDDIGDAISDGASAVGSAVSDAAGSAYDSVTQGGVGDAIGWVGGAVDTATGGLASATLDATDDYVFDTVDYVTGGIVDVDFDDGQFSANVGIDGVAHAGASFGEDGITASSGAFVGGGFDLGVTHDGFTASGSAGIDYGPLPYAEGHVQLAANGDVLVNGRAQGTLPTPYGIFSGQTEAGFTSTDAGWGGYLNSQGSWTLPSGVKLAGGEHLAYAETADGDSQLSVGVNGSVSYLGASVGGGVDYDRAEHDGNVVENVNMHGEVDALGMKATGEVDYHHSNIDGVDSSDWSSDGDVQGPDLNSALTAAGKLAKAEFGGDDGGATDGLDGVDDALGGADVGDLGLDGVDDVGDIGDMGVDSFASSAADFAPTDAASVAAAPMDDFSSAIQSADTVEQSMDDLSSGLTGDPYSDAG
jgi:hypothetical protein